MFKQYWQTESTRWSDWRWQLKNQIRSSSELAQIVPLAPERLAEITAVEQVYPLRISPYYLSLAQSSNPDDPILRQCLPDGAELLLNDGQPDALAEETHSPVPRLVHRYADRALYISNKHCAVHCRHCMRKRHWCSEMASQPSNEEIAQAQKYLREHPELREILISGGDPLLLPENKLHQLIEAFSAVPNIEILRFGSRLPATLPQRFTPRFCRLLASGKPAWLVSHFNHPSELTIEAAQAVEHLLQAGIPVLNQTVLLKGINDNAETLKKLFTGLLRLKIKPYYLFHADPIQGCMHFRTGLQKGLEILDALRGRISGMALPHYAFDLPQGEGKIRLEPDVKANLDPEGRQLYRSYQGKCIAYDM
ncbi:MAG: KamA family radical SAM protein [Oligosphaeraceae bacterium]|nr:KamA family radical SAM protein [Oligosphaeraceae bacterium]